MAVEALDTKIHFFQQGLYCFIQLGILEGDKFYKFITM